MKLKITVLIMIMIISLFGCSSGKKESFKAEAEISVSSSSSAAVREEPERVCVYVCGEVACPGVYELAAGSRVKDAISMAGGLSLGADPAAVNQAQKLKDQEKIVVPAKNNPSGTSASGGLMNINTATRDQLLTLPGIGEAKAAAIISYREAHGGFQSVEELQKIEGIKSGVFNKIKDSVSVY